MAYKLRVYSLYTLQSGPEKTAQSLIHFSCRRCHVHMRGDVAHNVSNFGCLSKNI